MARFGPAVFRQSARRPGQAVRVDVAQGSQIDELLATLSQQQSTLVSGADQRRLDRPTGGRLPGLRGGAQRGKGGCADQRLEKVSSSNGFLFWRQVHRIANVLVWCSSMEMPSIATLGCEPKTCGPAAGSSGTSRASTSRWFRQY